MCFCSPVTSVVMSDKSRTGLLTGKPFMRCKSRTVVDRMYPGPTPILSAEAGPAIT